MPDRTLAPPPGHANRSVTLCLAATLLAGLWSIGCGVLYPRLIEPTRVDEVFTPAELAAAPFPRAAARLSAWWDDEMRARTPWVVLITPGAVVAAAALAALIASQWKAFGRMVPIVATVAFSTAVTVGGFAVAFQIFDDDAVAMTSVDAVLTPAELMIPATRSAMYEFGRRMAEACRDEWLLIAAGLPSALAGLAGLWAVTRGGRRRGGDEPTDLFASE
ncbi:hypothetical protein [Alienimonas chondri]|uniref:DUF1772 domain-containing protein n=1 Tax=Alienimonas chondri TaxID=2681879 RepID=A0ABX1VF16_9PLAN|nr:hypothetical protein [Alienimonas chondri]NNJ26680.1 hypothetical protein [Alienimonas chondri]